MRGQPGVLCFALHSLNASLNNVSSPQGLLAVFALDKFCIRPNLCIQSLGKDHKAVKKYYLKKKLVCKGKHCGQSGFSKCFHWWKGWNVLGWVFWHPRMSWRMNLVLV